MKPAPSSLLLMCLALVLAAGVSSAATVAEEVARLRTEANDLDAAVALAQEYLQVNPGLTSERQSVQFELGRTYYAAKQYDAALTTLRGLVADYTMTTLDKANEAFVVDDAQFYVGVIEHYFGDRAKGIEGYTKAIDDFPKSSRRPQALMLLAGVYEQDGEKAKSLERFKQLVAEHPKSEQAPEAQLHVGLLLRDDGKLDDAIAAFQRVAADWPESKHAPMALLDANRALMEQEIRRTEAVGIESEELLDNEQAIVANAELLMERYGDSEEIAQVMQDMINYYSNPYRFLLEEGSLARVDPYVAWLREHKPETRQGMRAVCEYAARLGRDNIDEALAQLDWVADLARQSGDDSLLFDVQFVRGRVLAQAGRSEDARAVLTELIESAATTHTADEIRVMLVTLDPIEKRLTEYGEIGDDEQRQPDIRSMAMTMLAVDHYRECRYEEAIALVDRVIADFPETLSVHSAKRLRAKLERLVKVPIENRPDYVRR